MRKAVIILIGIILLLMLSVDFYPKKVVRFEDNNLEQSIRQNLRIVEGEILNRQLNRITILDLSGQSISNLAGIENLQNLKILNLSRNRIEDISTIRNLVHLERLNLSNNFIRHIDALSGLDHLEDLNLKNNRIESLQPLQNLKKLKNKLYVGGNLISDYSPVAYYYNDIRKKDFLLSISLSSTQNDLVINEVMASTSQPFNKKSGKSSYDWIEIHNKSQAPIDLEGFGLSDRLNRPYRWRFPKITIAPKGFLVVEASGSGAGNGVDGLHASFKIKKGGEPLMLTDPYGKLVDMIMVVPAQRDQSIGRQHDGADKWVFFEEPTPGCRNLGLWFSHQSEFYKEPFYLTIESSDDGCSIHYTLDGSEPTAKSPLYTSPMKIENRSDEENKYSAIKTSYYWTPPIGKVFKATALRARLFMDNQPIGGIITKTYFVDAKIDERFKLPVVSLVSDPGNLFDYENGIYIQGLVYDNWKKKRPVDPVKRMDYVGNYSRRGRDAERPVHIEFFEPDGRIGFSQNAGLRIFGGGNTRKLPQKSLCIYARSIYDSKNNFNYRIFPTLQRSDNKSYMPEKFKHILLRVSGQDSQSTMIRDALIQSLMNQTKLNDQAYRPAVVLINGEYWGIHNIRKHLDEHYLKNRYQVDKDKIVILENNSRLKWGTPKDSRHYEKMIEFIKKNDIGNQNNYYHITTIIDVDNYIDYNIINIYCDNQDWPGNNVRYWRIKKDGYQPDAPYGHDGRWRWFLYDTDAGFGFWTGEHSYRYNTLEHATMKGLEKWPNPDWSTFLLRSLLKNKTFRISFINRFADHLNSNFNIQNVLNRIGELMAVIAPEIPAHLRRWSNLKRSADGWQREVNKLRLFATKRPDHLRRHMVDFFGLDGMANVTLDISDKIGGKIKVNTLELAGENFPWEGIYFKNIPVKIIAKPNPGYSFKGWNGSCEETSDTIVINLNQDFSCTALFERDGIKASYLTVRDKLRSMMCDN